jgi:hypothetical protein
MANGLTQEGIKSQRMKWSTQTARHTEEYVAREDYDICLMNDK